MQVIIDGTMSILWSRSCRGKSNDLIFFFFHLMHFKQVIFFRTTTYFLARSCIAKKCFFYSFAAYIGSHIILFVRTSPCLNGAECQDLINGYNCICPKGFTGKKNGYNSVWQYAIRSLKWLTYKNYLFFSLKKL